MAKGDGSIYQVKDKDGRIARNKWRVVLPLGIDPISGKRQRKSQIVIGTKTDARKALQAMRVESESGIAINADKLTFCELCKQWEEARQLAHTCSDNRLKSENYRLNYFCSISSFGLVKVHDIKPTTIEKLLNRIIEDKRASNSQFGNTSLNEYFALLKRLFGYAVDHDIILRNPCDRVKAPRADKPNRRSLSSEDFASLWQTVGNALENEYSQYSEKELRQSNWSADKRREAVRYISRISCLVAVKIGLATGARRGEILALDWEHVLINKASITIAQSLTNNTALKCPKTESSIRTIALDSETVSALKKWKEYQGEQMERIGLTQTQQTPVCCSDLFGLMDPNNFSRWWRGWVSEVGFENLKFHELRHTHATLLLGNGRDVKTVQSRLGHASASTTLNLYAHALPENDRKAADLIGALATSKKRPVLAYKTA